MQMITWHECTTEALNMYTACCTSLCIQVFHGIILEVMYGTFELMNKVYVQIKLLRQTWLTINFH